MPARHVAKRRSVRPSQRRSAASSDREWALRVEHQAALHAVENDRQVAEEVVTDQTDIAFTPVDIFCLGVWSGRFVKLGREDRHEDRLRSRRPLSLDVVSNVIFMSLNS
jgi:hypothetical protein